MVRSLVGLATAALVALSSLVAGVGTCPCGDPSPEPTTACCQAAADTLSAPSCCGPEARVSRPAVPPAVAGIATASVAVASVASFRTLPSARLAATDVPILPPLVLRI